MEKIRTWDNAYYGLISDFISPNECLLIVDNKLLGALDTEKLGELYSSTDNKELFLNCLSSLVSHPIKKDDTFWMKHFLNKIERSEITKTDKLNKVVQIWALFNYPEEWRDFIHYLPVENGLETGIDALYDRFIVFLKTLNA